MPGAGAAPRATIPGAVAWGVPRVAAACGLPRVAFGASSARTAPATARQQVAVAQIFRRIMRILSHSGTAGPAGPGALGKRGKLRLPAQVSSTAFDRNNRDYRDDVCLGFAESAER